MQHLKCYGVCYLCSEEIRGFKSKYEARHCVHIFHRLCLDEWRLRSNICPIPTCQSRLDYRISRVRGNQVMVLDAPLCDYSTQFRSKNKKLNVVTRAWNSLKNIINRNKS